MLFGEGKEALDGTTGDGSYARWHRGPYAACVEQDCAGAFIQVHWARLYL